MTTSPISQLCPCLNETKSSLVKDAERMTESIRNKTGLFSKIHHRATHSTDAFWASTVVSVMVISVVVAVLWSKMWKEKTFLSLHSSLPIRYEQYNSKAEILFKDMLKSKAQSMSQFLRRKNRDVDEVDSSTYHTLLKSYPSTSSSSSSISSDWEDDYLGYDPNVFSLDRRTGEWIVVDGQRSSSPSSSLISNSNRFLQFIQSCTERKSQQRKVSYRKIDTKGDEDLALLSSTGDEDEEQNVVMMG